MSNQGYNPNFLADGKKKNVVKLPVLNKEQLNDLAPSSEDNSTLLHYQNYSLQLSASRRFPYFTASNIDGHLFQKAARASSWKKDPRVKDFQWGTELYSAAKSDFDKGHMTRREDVQWGETPEAAQEAANSTFYYTNAVPQHKDLNQKLWKSLEDYILHDETKKKLLRICVFTGPLLSERDPLFVSDIKGEAVRLPVIFWKVIVYPKEDGKLYRVGFIMSQKQLLLGNAIAVASRGPLEADPLFMGYDKAETYQVTVPFIEEITGIKMPKAKDIYQDERATDLIYTEVEVPDSAPRSMRGPGLSYWIKNLVV